MASGFPGQCGRPTYPSYASPFQHYPRQPEQKMSQQYGAMGAFLPDMEDKTGQYVFARAPRRRMNIVSVAISLFMPWLLFCIIFAIMSFSIHYHQPQAAYAAVGLGFLLVLAFGLQSVDAFRKDPATSGYQREPTWYAFMFVTSLLAWTLGIIFGDANFARNMQPFYDVGNLNVYPSIDPARTRGQQVMDAGRIVFQPGSHLDLQRSVGFKNLDTYCVAPIVSGSENATKGGHVNYDFWAVGLNCCSGSQPDFHCGEYNNRHAHAGLRVMRDDLRPFFRLAVQEAEAAYSIKAVHPIFLYWMQDPVGEANAYREDGFKYFILGMFSHFSMQLFFVIASVVAIFRIQGV